MGWNVGVLVSLAGLSASANAAVPPKLDFLFEETVTLDKGESMGETPRGGRAMVGITGGTFKGAGLKGSVLPGGWDWQQIRSDGCLQIAADYFLRTDDGVLIKVHNIGLACPPVNGVTPPVYTWPEFETPRGKYEWLTRTPLVGLIDPPGQSIVAGVNIRFYRLNPGGPD